MDRFTEPETIPLSLLNAFEYCPRRFYYEFVQGDMLINEFVLEGSLQHEHADQPGTRLTPDGDREVRRLYLVSERLRLAGFADIVVEHEGMLMPVEYKHGKEGKWLNDHIQLCAQALCLEERFPERPPITQGYIFYFGSRKRVEVQFTPELRERTQQAITAALALAASGQAPAPLEGKLAARCRDCSLRPLCLPEEVQLLRTKKGKGYADPLFD